MAEFKLDDVTKTVKDAAYITVGLGVIGFQKLQVQRVELEKTLKEQFAGAKGEATKLTGSFDEQIKLVEARIEAVEAQVDAILDQFQARLPEQAADLMSQARTAAKEARTQVRGLVGRVA